MAQGRDVIPVTKVEYAKAQSVFEAAAEKGIDCISVDEDEGSVAAAVKEHRACAVIVGVDTYAGALYEALPKGGIIARFGVGFDSVDLAQAAKAGIVVTNTPGALSDAVAEHAIWLAGAVARKVGQAHHDMKNNHWQSRVGIELGGKTLAVIGCGLIGMRVARIASAGFRMKVVGHDVIAPATESRIKWGVERFEMDLAPALADADFVTVHIPSIPETKHLINADTIAMMKDGAYLINTARGPVVDEIALYDALSSGKLAGAGLDVFETEPYQPRKPDKDLRTLDNVVLTCHMASASTEACRNMATMCLANVSAAFEGRFVDCNIVNPDVLKVLEG